MVLPCTRTPGDFEYYESTSVKEKVTVSDFTINSIGLQFLDHLDRPLIALKEFAVVTAVDHMSREHERTLSVMKRSLVLLNLYSLRPEI